MRAVVPYDNYVTYRNLLAEIVGGIKRPFLLQHQAQHQSAQPINVAGGDGCHECACKIGDEQSLIWMKNLQGTGYFVGGNVAANLLIYQFYVTAPSALRVTI